MMKCYVYKSLRRDGAYLFVADKDEFATLPESLMDLFGQPQYVMELDLTTRRNLAAADADQVVNQLQESGYYLQLPAKDHVPT